MMKNKKNYKLVNVKKVFDKTILDLEVKKNNFRFITNKINDLEFSYFKKFDSVSEDYLIAHILGKKIKKKK
jgi:hypothetical protein